MVSNRAYFSKAFTLIELLVVIAIIAILSVVVILTLSPAELLRQSRDTNRISDMSTLSSAISLYLTDQSTAVGFSMGSTSTVYVSIADPTATSTAGDQCQGLGLPVLPAGNSYHCAASSTFRNTNGTGWIPINFSSITSGVPFGNEPVDPINTSSTRNYYTYTTNGTQFELTTPMESVKYKLGGTSDVISFDGSTFSTIYVKGTNLTLEPLDYGDSSMVGYWPLNEGTGTVAYDYSGSGINGTWNGTQTGTNGYYSPGKVQTWAGTFDGTSTYNFLGNNSVLNVGGGNFTISLWFQGNSNNTSQWLVGNEYAGNGGIMLQLGSSNTSTLYYYNSGFIQSATGVLAGKWYHYVLEDTNSGAQAYLNGVQVLTNGPVGYWKSLVAYWNIGAWASGGNTGYSRYFGGYINNVRIYNRALSASEVAAMYNGGK